MDFKKIFHPNVLFRRRSDSSAEHHDVYLIAYYLGLLLIACAVVQFLLLFYIPVKPNLNLVEVYSRNYTSIVCYALLGAFFIRLGYYGSGLFENRKDMKWFKVLILVVAVASFAKALLSGFLAATHITGGFVFVFYVVDFLTWLTVGMYLIVYKRVKLAGKRKPMASHTKEEKMEEVFYNVAIERNEPEHHHHSRGERVNQSEIQHYLDKAYADGIGKGYIDSNIKTAKILKYHNVPIGIIMECTGLAEELIMRL